MKDYALCFKHDQDTISLIYYYCGIGENSINVLNEILRIDQKCSTLCHFLYHTLFKTIET